MTDILLILQHGEIELQGQFLYGSNYTFLVELTHQGEKLKAVYKPAKGERPLWDFPEGTLGKREVAAYLLSEALGWHLVPKTLYRQDGPLGEGSLQEYIGHDPNHHFFTMSPAERASLRKTAVFDILINNADRKGGHLLFDDDGKIWLIDQALCFHTEDKLRTVIWDFIGQPIEPDLIADISRLSGLLKQEGELTLELAQYLTEDELSALKERMIEIINNPVFRGPREDSMPYPWPPV